MTSPRPPKEPAVGETVRFTHALSLPTSTPDPHIGMRFDKARVLISKAFLDEIAASTEYPEDASDARLMLHHASPAPDGILSRQQYEAGGLDRLDLIRLALESGNATVEMSGSGAVVRNMVIDYFGSRPAADASIIGMISYEFDDPDGGSGTDKKKQYLFAVPWYPECRPAPLAPESVGAVARPRPPEEPDIGETVQVSHRHPLQIRAALPRVRFQFNRALVLIAKADLEGLSRSIEHPAIASDARRLLERSASIPDGLLSSFDFERNNLDYVELISLALESGRATLRSLRAGVEKEIPEMSITYIGKRPNGGVENLGLIHYAFDEPRDGTRPVEEDRLFARTPCTPLFQRAWRTKVTRASGIPVSPSFTDLPAECERVWFASAAASETAGSGPPDEPGIGDVVHVTYERALPASVPLSRIVIPFGRSLLGISKAYLEALGASTAQPDLASDARRLLQLARETPDNSLFRSQLEQGGLGDLRLIRWCLESGNAMIRSQNEEILGVSITYRGTRSDVDTRVLGTITYAFDLPNSRRTPVREPSSSGSLRALRTHLFMVPWYARGTSP